MEQQHPCYYPGEFAPPTKMHLNSLYWLLNRPEVSHVNVVIGKTNGPISQDQKARMWEMLIKSSFSPQATIIKSKENGPLSEVYSLFEVKPDKPAYIALDEESSRNKKLQKKFSRFPNYGMQLLPSQFYKSSAALQQAAQNNDIEAAKEELPDDFSNEQISEYLSILNERTHDEPLVDKSPLLKSYSEQYQEMFNDGFWKSVFEPMAESASIQEAISDSAKKKALEKFKKEKPELGDQQIKYYIDKFSDKQSSNVFQKKDIFQYKFDELEKIIDANFSSDVSKKTDGDEVDFKGSEDVVYNKNGLLVLLGNLKEKCIRYGKGYSWCISRKDSSNMFFSYRMRLNEPVFYFVFDEDKPKEDKHHAIVIYINKQGEYYVASSLNTGDEEMSWSEIESIQPKLKGLKDIFKHIPLTAEEKKDYERFKNQISDEEYDKLNYTDKEKYIGFGHDLTEKQIRSTPKELVSKYAVTTVGENIPEDIEKSLSTSDRKKLKDNRVERYGDHIKFLQYQDELTPEDLKVKEDLNLSFYDITSLPDNLEVGGDLRLYASNITSLPNNLKVGGDLDLSNSKITSLPDDLKIGGGLYLSYTNITSLPDNLEVGGSLDLSNTKITSLPDNLKVGKRLSLSYTNITYLPDNLEVEGVLNLSNTKITSLPDNLKVGGDLELYNSKITSLPDNLKVGGSIDLNDSKITSLPDNLKVEGNLDLSETEINSLPNNLKVEDNLYLFKTKITSLPDDLEIGAIMTDNLDLKKQWREIQAKRSKNN